MAHGSPTARVGAHPTEQHSAQLLPLTAVRLTDGPLFIAQLRDLEYVLALDVDRLAAPYRREAGLPARSPGYGNWEADGMGGHVGGHVLSALSLLDASTGDPRVAERLDHLLDELQECQDARDDGFLGGVPDGAALATELAGGRLEADLFELNGRWVPLYNLHKTLSGLLDAAVHAHRPRALAMATRLADWLLGAVTPLDDAQVERLLHCEPGGLSEVLTALGETTGDARFTAGARRLLHRAVLDPLLQGRDALDGLHANTQIPKVIGYEALGQAIGDPDLLGASEAFWHHVVRGRTVAIGGNSVREHFHDRNDFTAVITDRQGPEGCNTVNMIELSVLQYLRTGRLELVDYVERALFNHVLASQHPERGGFVYFTPMRPDHYRVYSQPQTSMWCCVGSGMEAHARHGAFLAVRGQVPGSDEGTLDVLVYAGAEIADESSGLRVSVSREGLGPGRVSIEVRRAPTGDSPLGVHGGAVLRLRRPSWSRRSTARVVEGDARLDSSDEHWFVVHLPAGKHLGTVVVEVDLPADIAVEPLPDGSAWAALVHGPLVLAARGGAKGVSGLGAGEARMAHVAAGPLVPLASTPVLREPEGARDRGDGTASVRVWVPAEDGEQEVDLVLHPFAELHDERYTLYWPTGDPASRREQLRTLDRDGDQTGVIDEVTGGEQQPESDHRMVGAGSTAGRQGTLHWRSATGWFSYELQDPAGAGRHVQVRHRGTTGWADVVTVDGATLREVALDAAPEGCVDRTFALAGPFTEAPTSHLVRFTALDGRPTRDVVRLRLLP